jgi:hypothetical protein
VKHNGGAFGSKTYDSWNKAKDKLTTGKYNKCRRANACIDCGEVGHKFSDCHKQKPGLIENDIGFVATIVHVTLSPISQLPFAIDEYGVSKLNSDYPIESI